MLKDRLKLARKNAKKSQADVADAINITQSAYSQLETGRVDSSSHLPSIAKFLGVDAIGYKQAKVLLLPNEMIATSPT